MKIAVDGYLFRHSTRGMARFGKTLAAALGNECLTLEPPGTQESEIYSHGSGKRPSFPYWEQWILPRLASANHVDTLLCPYNTGPLRLPPGIRLVLVIHDLIFLDRTVERSVSMVQNVGRLYRQIVVPRVARKAFHIVTVSAYSKERITALLGIPESRITVIPNAIGDFWFDHGAKAEVDSPYLLTVAGEAPSKNLDRLIQAFAKVHSGLPRLRLVVVGVKPAAHLHFHEVAAKFGVADRVTFSPYLTDDELKRLYLSAQVYVCPSLAEGFGIPVLEAMALGVPVACSNRSSLPEVCGDAATYFDPYDTSSIAESILAVINTPHQTSSRIERGRARAAHFAEANVAQQIMKFWRRLGIL